MAMRFRWVDSNYSKSDQKRTFLYRGVLQFHRGALSARRGSACGDGM